MKYIFQFILFILLQVLVLNNIQGLPLYININLYLIFILLLPIKIENIYLLFISFLLGFIIDIFSNTYGIHAAATTFIAFLRPSLIKLILSREEIDQTKSLSINNQGFRTYLSFIFTLVLLHNIILFWSEVFKFSEFGYIFLKTIFSSIFTVLVITIFQMIFFEKDKRDSSSFY